MDEPSFPRMIKNALLPSCAMSIGLLLAFLVLALFSDAGDLFGVMFVILALVSLWLTPFASALVAGLLIRRQTSNKSQGFVGGAVAGGLAGLFAVVAIVTALRISVALISNGTDFFSNAPLAEDALAPSQATTAFALVLASGLTGGLAGIPGDGGARGAVASTPAPQATSPILAPSPSPSPMMSSSLPAGLVQCPRCGTRIQAPPQRPVELVCPTCQYRGTLRV